MMLLLKRNYYQKIYSFDKGLISTYDVAAVWPDYTPNYIY